MMLVSGCDFTLESALHRNKFDATVQLPRFKAGRDTHVDELVNTEGYYAGAPDDSTYRQHLLPFLFCKDGTFGVFRFIFEYPFLKMKNVSLAEHACANWPIMGGNYIIKGDTIVVDMYSLRKARWRLDRLRFKVVARDTLLLFERETDVTKKGKHTERRECHQYYVFVPAKPVPSNGFPIRRKKWMWENEDEWKQNKSLINSSLPVFIGRYPLF